MGHVFINCLWQNGPTHFLGLKIESVTQSLKNGAGMELIQKESASFDFSVNFKISAVLIETFQWAGSVAGLVRIGPVRLIPAPVPLMYLARHTNTTLPTWQEKVILMKQNR